MCIVMATCLCLDNVARSTVEWVQSEFSIVSPEFICGSVVVRSVSVPHRNVDIFFKYCKAGSLQWFYNLTEVPRQTSCHPASKLTFDDDEICKAVKKVSVPRFMCFILLTPERLDFICQDYYEQRFSLGGGGGGVGVRCRALLYCVRT